MSIESTPREDLKIRAQSILEKAGLELLKHGVANEFDVRAEHDIHALYHLMPNFATDPTATDEEANILGLQVQAYPGLSTDKDMAYMARFVNIARLRKQQSAGDVSFGNEHEAIIARHFRGQQEIKMLTWGPRLVANLIAGGVSELGTSSLPIHHHAVYRSAVAQPTTHSPQS